MAENNIIFPKHPFNSPYPFRETLGWLWRNAVGPSKKNIGNIEFIDRQIVLNLVDTPSRIGIIGDIMDLGGKAFQISESLKHFFSDCDYLIGNFEATLTHEPRAWVMDQIHDEQILESMAKLFSPEKTYLSVANNHAGDFKKDIFLDSCRAVKNSGFQLFGLKEQPFIDITSNLRIFGASKWSNKPTDIIANIGSLSNVPINKDGFNLLYPHWGWELELYPRMETIDQSRDFLNKFDAVVGHHSHTPQPITIQEIEGIKKPLAYSLGDFCFGKPFKMFFFGEILKMDVGRLKNPSNRSKWAVGNLEWSFVKSTIYNSKEVFIDLSDSIPLFKEF